LIAGIVLTGGGSQLNHLKQLVEYITGMDTRIGFPNEHLAGDEHAESTASPMFSTAVGLVMKAVEQMSAFEELAEDDHEAEEAETGESTEQQEVKKRRSIFDRFTEGIREFLDNAE
jgi:cell division protein FtsA